MRMSAPPSTTPIVAKLPGVEIVGHDGAWASFEVPDDQVAAARALGAEEAKTAGVIDITLRVLVGDAAALIAAGRRSVARDNHGWDLGQPLPPAEDPDQVIDGPAQAMVDLLMEGMVRCFRPMVTAPDPLVDKVTGIEDMQWGERTWTSEGRGFLESIIAAIRAEHPTATKAYFGVEEWDNGYFFTGHPTFELADGSEEIFEGEEPGISLDGGLTADLTSAYGPVGERGQLLLTLATGDVTAEGEGGLF